MYKNAKDKNGKNMLKATNVTLLLPSNLHVRSKFRIRASDSVESEAGLKPVS